MSILSALADITTWVTAGKVASGVVLTKVWQWVKAKAAAAKAEAAKIETDVKADIKKL